MSSKCCVIGCNNTKKNKDDITLYHFPTAWFKQEQRRQWINAVRLQNSDGSNWEPKKNSLICSAHFVGNRKSDIELHPSYIPTIFPKIYKKRAVNETAALNRHKRFMKRRKVDVSSSSCHQESYASGSEDGQQNHLDTSYNFSRENSTEEIEKTFHSQECQVDFLPLNEEFGSSFTCNRYITPNVCEVEIQTNISEFQNSKVKFFEKKKTMKDKQCSTPVKTFSDKEVNCDTYRDSKRKSFQGIESVKSDDQLIDLAGISLHNFNLFVEKCTLVMDKTLLSKENQLLLFFVKMKTGLTYSALSVLFQVDRTTISRYFIKILNYLSSALRNSIKWFDKDTVLQMVPDCFKPVYSDVRIILDCTEFPIEVPAGVDNRVYTYSHYKKKFTAKVLVGCTPNGLITFVSKCAGGRKSDSQITVESGLIDLLEDSDKILADKGFPQIKTIIGDKGKQVLVIMPPFLTNPEFTKEEAQETYNVANVRIHIERIMQRIKLFNIFSKIPAHLFHHIDAILLVCCVLVNLQPPIIAAKD